MAFPFQIDEDDPATGEPSKLAQRACAALALLGSATSYVGVATLEMSQLAFDAQLVLATMLLIVGIAVATLRPRQRLLNVAVLLGVVAISGMIATADDLGTTPFFYLWPAVFAAYFASVRFLAATVFTIAATLAGALVVNDLTWSVRVDYLIGTTLSVGMMGFLVSHMRSRAERLNAKLELAAGTDALTGLRNRRAFDPDLELMVGDAARTGAKLSIVMCDLDHFKRFNDAHGHIVGDEALRRMSAALQEQCRPIDTVARFGGEEFVVVLPGVGAAGARSYAERVAWGLGVETIDEALRLTASCGIATFGPEGADESAISLLTRADEALYAAKHAGRSRAAWWADGGIRVGETIDVPRVVDVVSGLPAELSARRVA